LVRYTLECKWLNKMIMFVSKNKKAEVTVCESKNSTVANLS
jgi:hypothetical protein